MTGEADRLQRRKGTSAFTILSILLGIVVGSGIPLPLSNPGFEVPDFQGEPSSPFVPEVSRPAPTANGVREYTLVAKDVEHEVFPGVGFTAWTLNGSFPAPTLTAIESETVKVTFVNRSPRPQTLHFHGVHRPESDGVHEVVNPGQYAIYELEAAPPGLYLFHSHMSPIAEHQNRGFFGAYIVYPSDPAVLPPAREFVLMMHFIDTDGDFAEAEFYGINGAADAYFNNPLDFSTGERVRIYLVNQNIEFATLHIHANVFTAYMGLGMDRTRPLTSDVVGLGWGERAVLEFSYKYVGLYMFHDHISEHSDLGLKGWFRVGP